METKRAKKARRYLIFEALMFIFLLALNIAFLNDFPTGAILFKAAASLFFVMAGICGYIRNREQKRFSRLMLIGFICCMGGDVFLALDSKGIIFVIGVASFAAAHVLFAAAFCGMCAVTKKDIAAALVMFVVLVLVLCLGNFDFQGLLPVLIGYAAVISFMVVKALSLWRCRRKGQRGVMLIMSGGVLFLLSDVVLLFWLFGVGVEKEVQVVNWVIYYLAQGCLTAALNQGWEAAP